MRGIPDRKQKNTKNLGIPVKPNKFKGNWRVITNIANIIDIEDKDFKTLYTKPF